MASALWKSRVFTGFGSAGYGGKTDDKALDTSLKRATHSERVDVEKDALLAIAQSSHNEEDRRTIMRHLAVSLSDDSSSKWRVINASLTVVEHLLRHGNQDIVLETASGMHFDLVQRLSFLEKFENSIDKRVESMIRRRALSLRGLFIEKQAQAIAQEEKLTKKLRKQKKAFHTEDTDDDLSSSDEEPVKVLPRKHDNLLEVTTTDGEFVGEESCGSDGPSPRASPLYTGVDLLAANEHTSTTSPSKHTQDMDLLDLPASAKCDPGFAETDLLHMDQDVSTANLKSASMDLLNVEQDSSFDLI